MIVKLMINEYELKSKEACNQYVSSIKKNEKCKSSTKEVTVEELGKYIINGHTIVPSILEEDKPLRAEYFKGTQIFGLDFDNEEIIIINGEKEKRRAKEASYLTADKIFKICNAYRIKPFMIYETFSSIEDWKRYRVLFATKYIITDIAYRRKILQALIDIFSIDGTTTVDTSCTDPSRVFYAGKLIVYQEEVYLDEIKVLKVDDKINKNGKKKDTQKPSKSSNNADLGDQGISVHTYNKIKKHTRYVCTENIELIKARDYEGLRAVLGADNVEFSSLNECINYMTHEIDMARFLGIQNVKSFSCIFHKDANPSAGITQLADGQFFYKCFSSNCGFKGNIIAVTAELLGSSRVKAIKFIQKVYNLNVAEPEWSKEYREELKENIRMIMDEEIKEIFPTLNSVVSRYYKDIICIHEFAIQNIYYKDSKNNIIFFVSQNKLATFLNTQQSSVCRRLALFALLKLIYKVDDRNVPADLRKKSEKISKNNNKKDTIQYYCILSYTWGNLAISNKRAEIYKKNHCTMKGMSRELIYRSFDEEVANEVYPKRQDENIKDESENFKRKFEKCLLKMIDQKGYATENKIINELKGYKVIKEINVKRVLGQVVDENRLQRIRANKKLKQKYAIKGNGYPYVIIRMQE